MVLNPPVVVVCRLSLLIPVMSASSSYELNVTVLFFAQCRNFLFLMSALPDDRLKVALAVAIVKERRSARREEEALKQRAIKAEEELCRLKSSLEGRSCQELLKRLPELTAMEEEAKQQHVGVEDVCNRRQALVVFLKNVHALRTAEVSQQQMK